MASFKLLCFVFLLFLTILSDSIRNDAPVDSAKLDAPITTLSGTNVAGLLPTDGTASDGETNPMNQSNSVSKASPGIQSVDFNQNDNGPVHNTHRHAWIGIVVVALSLILGSLLFTMWRCFQRQKDKANDTSSTVNKKEYHIPELDLEDLDEVMEMRRRESGCSNASRGSTRQKRFASISVISRELLTNHLRGTAERVESDESSLEMDSDHDEHEVDCIDTDSDHGEGVQIVVHEQ